MPRQDRWTIAHAEEDGMALLFRYRNEIPVKDPAGFPYVLSIVWEYDGDQNLGMPADETLAQMERLEDSLDSIDDRDALLMVVVTGNNRREWIWYVDDTSKYMSLLNQALRGKPKFPIDFSASEDPAWLTYLSIREAMPNAT